jgi:hypothetical protein
MPDNITYRIFENIGDVDISETDIWDYDQAVLRQLLIDHTASAKARKEKEDPNIRVNIFWATSDYEQRGEGYGYHDQIMPEKIVGENGRVIMPRVLKDRQLQIARSKDKAEVFTPSWVCNAQNNLIDEAWFGRKDVFNREVVNEDGTHSWIPTEGKIEFSEGKSWKKYVSDNRLEITCGEAPYLVSRYDTTTGEPIPLTHRIGLLDRKLRIVSENCDTTTEWLEMARKAYQHTYGYEWQGDNLLLAREALLYTFIEYYIDKFGQSKARNKVPTQDSIEGIARIIAWNIWQMDGLRMVIPDSCDNVYEENLFGERAKQECQACKTGSMTGHIGTKCLIRDWNKKKPAGWEPAKGEDPKSSPWQKIEFSSLLNRNQNEEEPENE